MSRLVTSSNLAAIVALAGCTAAILVSSDASAFTRGGARPAAARQRTPVAQRPTFRPSIRPRVVQSFARPTASLARPQFRPSSPVRFPHPGTVAGGFPHPTRIGGAFPTRIGGAYPTHIGGAFPTHIGGAYPAHIGGAYPAHIGGAYPAHIGGAYPAHIGGAYPAHIGGAYPAHIGGAYPAHIGGAYPAHIGGAYPAHIGSTFPAHIGGTFPAHIGGTAARPNLARTEPQGSTTSDASGFNAKPAPVKLSPVSSQQSPPKAVQAMILANTKLGPVFVPPPKAVQAMILAQQLQKTQPSQGSPCPTLVYCHPKPISGAGNGDGGNAGGGNAGGGNGNGGGGFVQNPGSQQPGNDGGAGGGSYAPVAAAQPDATPAAAAAPAPAPMPVAAAAYAPTAPTAPTAAPAAPANPMYVYVLFQQNASVADVASFLQAYKASIVEGPSQDQVYKLQLTDPMTPDVLAQTVESMKTQTNIVSQVVTN